MEGFVKKQPALEPYLKNSILNTAKLAGITAILSITGTIVAAIASFSKSTATAAKEGFGEGVNFDFNSPSIFSVIITLIINGLLFYHLFRFSKISRSSLQNDHNHLLASGFYSLASYFRIIAILFILSSVMIVIAALALIGGKVFR